MRHIHKIFNENSATIFEKTYQERFNFESTVHIGLFIKPMNQSNVFDLYYVPSNKLLSMIIELNKISKEFINTFDHLPKIAQKQFIIECIAEELYNTNELEGVRSTREEIVRSTKDFIFKRKNKKRFESMIKSYFRLLNNDFEFPKTSEDIRKIYDDITNGEIEKQELPDGAIFRKENTYILKKSGSGKVIHEGIMPESEIISLTDRLLHFMNEDSEIPNMVKIAIGHYYFGYIHPFYDGNGRTSRFISSMYLAKDLGNISTLSLSRGCNKYKNKYLDAFEITNSIRSRGEMNSFIDSFLEITIEALKQMDAELKEKSELLSMALKKLEKESKLMEMSQGHKDLMFVLAQNQFFDSSSGLNVGDLSRIFEKSEVTIRKIIKELLALNLIEQRGQRPAYFSIRHKYFEE